MAMAPHDARKLREAFSKANGKSVPDISVDGDDLEVMLLPHTNEMALIVPYNEDGDCVSLVVSNAVIKRWRAECKEAERLMRRVASGEKNTAVREHQSVSRAQTRLN